MNRRIIVFTLLGVCVALAIYDMSLLGKGTFASPDEYYYMDALRTVENFSSVPLSTTAETFTGFSARPAATTLWLMPAAAQVFAASKLSTGPLDRRLIIIPTFWNVVIAVAIWLTIFRLSVFFYAGDGLAAALASVVYALLPTSHAWIRHVVPYDIALAIWLLILLAAVRRAAPPDEAASRLRIAIAGMAVAAITAIYVVSFRFSRSSGLPLSVLLLASAVAAVAYLVRRNEPDGARSSITLGILAGIAVAIYPAYYSFAPAVAVILALSGNRERVLSFRNLRFKPAAVFSLSAYCVACFYEVVARCGDVSYFGSSLRVAGTITQGSFEEGWVFLAKFLARLNGVPGVLAFALTVVFAGLLVLQRSRLQNDGDGARLLLARAFVIFALLYVVYGAESVLLHKMTFTGRYVRMYIPICIVAAVDVLRRLPPRIRALAMALTLFVSATGFISFARQYAKIEYPIDVLARLGIAFDDVAPANRLAESNVMPFYSYPVKSMMPGTHFRTQPNDHRFVLVNFAWFELEGPPFRLYEPPASARLIFSAINYQCSRLVQYEACSISRRAQFEAAGPCRLKIYDLPPNTSPVLSNGRYFVVP